MNKYNKEELELLVKESESLSEVYRKLNPNKKPHGGSVDHLKKTLIKMNIDFSHFTGRGWMKGRRGTINCEIGKDRLVQDYLKEGSEIITNRLKTYLIRYELLEYRCCICGNEGEWNGEKLTLQLDHINGVRNDNRLENLRILCPNCHSQTHTYSGKKNGGPQLTEVHTLEK